MAKQKSFRQMMNEGKAAIRQDAIEKREQINRSQYELDLYTRRSPKSNEWGFITFDQTSDQKR